MALFLVDRPGLLRRQRAEGAPGRLGARWSSRVVLFTLMTTWKTGRRLVAERLTARAHSARGLHGDGRARSQPVRVPGTAVFMTAQPTRHAAGARAQPPLQQGAARARRRADRDDRADAARADRGSPLGRAARHDLFNVRVQYGFMEDPERPGGAARRRASRDCAIDPDDLTYFLGRETIIVTRSKGMAIWREKLFVLMARNAVRATAFFRLPPERVVELGVQVEM